MLFEMNVKQKLMKMKNLKTNDRSQTGTRFVVLIAMCLSLSMMSCSDDPVLPTDDNDDGWIKPQGLYFQNGLYKDFQISGSLVEANTSGYQVELFDPEDNKETKRPLILLSPGGGWSSHSHLSSIKGMAFDLAKRGYVSGIVKYSLGTQEELSDPQKSVNLFLKGVQEQRETIRFFKANAEDYGIDPNNIFIGGWSSGAHISFANAFTDSREEFESMPDSDTKTATLNAIDAMGLDGDGNLDQSNSVKGALIMMGFFYSIDIIDENDVSLIMINHEKARIVADGTLIADQFEYENTNFFGTTSMYEKALDVGYVDGDNLEYILMDEWINVSNYEPNIAVLTSDNYDSIANFFYNNLD